MRIGVNAGSIPGSKGLERGRGGSVDETAELMVEAALGHIRILEELDFHQIKVSLKASDVATNLAANRKFAALGNRYPLHLGLTEAGPVDTGSIKSALGIGILLAEGIGDTIRYSLTADPVEEAKAGRQLLECLGLRTRKNVDLIACPSCGRAEIDVIAVANQAMEAFGEREIPLQVAVMGCVVNGPGEGMHADIGIAGGKHKGALFKSGKVVASLPEAELIDILIAELRAVAAEDAELLAAGKPLPVGLGDGVAAPEPARPLTPLPVV